MGIIKSSVTVLFCIVALTGCGDKSPVAQPEKSIEQNHTQSRKVTSKSVKGIVRGQAFKIEQAILHENTLTLREGKDFFADRSIDIVIFGSDTLENEKIKVGSETGFGRPHLRLGVKKENDELPDEIMVMDGYTMELAFGKANDLGIPFSIKLATNDPPRTDVRGGYFATFNDVRLKDGKVDLAYDSFDTLRHIACKYLNAKYTDIELLSDFNTSYKSNGDADFPKTGFVGYEAITDGAPKIVKLQLYKDEQGWRVANQLAENQIDQAHPFEAHSGKDERSLQASRARIVSALKLENYLNEQALMHKTRSTSVGCYTSKNLDKASCRAVYALKSSDEVVCMNKNYLLVRNDQEWHIEREISDTEKVDHATGELVSYKPFSMHCS